MTTNYLGCFEVLEAMGRVEIGCNQNDVGEKCLIQQLELENKNLRDNLQNFKAIKKELMFFISSCFYSSFLKTYDSSITFMEFLKYAIIKSAS